MSRFKRRTPSPRRRFRGPLVDLSRWVHNGIVVVLVVAILLAVGLVIAYRVAGPLPG